MQETVRQAFAAVDKCFVATHPLLVQLSSEIAVCSDTHEQADYAMALREVERMCDDMRKVAKANREKAEQICCAVAVKDGNVGVINTEYTTATPNIKMTASLPSRNKDPEQYAQLLKHFGVCQETIDSDTVRFHWPSMVEHISHLCEEGKPLPPGLDVRKVHPVYKLSPLRKMKGVLE